MQTIIFVLLYVFLFYSGERHLNFILTDLFIKPALLVVYAKICKHNNKETLN